jgi:WD40 repeat protein
MNIILATLLTFTLSHNITCMEQNKRIEKEEEKKVVRDIPPLYKLALSCTTDVLKEQMYEQKKLDELLPKLEQQDIVNNIASSMDYVGKESNSFSIDTIGVPELALNYDETLIAWDGMKGIMIDHTDTGFNKNHIETHDVAPSLIFHPYKNIIFGVLYSGILSAWDIDSCQVVETYGRNYSGHGCLALSPDGNLLASEEKNSSAIIVTNVDTKKQTILPQEKKSLLLDFNHDGSRLRCVNDDGEILIFDVATTQIKKKLLRETIDPFNERVDALIAAASPGKKYIAVCFRYKNKSASFVTIWDMETEQEWTSIGHFDEVTALAFNHQERILAVASTGYVKFFNIHKKTTSLLQELELYGKVTWLQFGQRNNTELLVNIRYGDQMPRHYQLVMFKKAFVDLPLAEMLFVKTALESRKIDATNPLYKSLSKETVDTLNEILLSQKEMKS